MSRVTEVSGIKPELAQRQCKCNLNGLCRTYIKDQSDSLVTNTQSLKMLLFWQTEFLSLPPVSLNSLHTALNS